MNRAEVLEAARIRRALRLEEAKKVPRATKAHPDDCRCLRCESTDKTP